MPDFFEKVPPKNGVKPFRQESFDVFATKSHIDRRLPSSDTKWMVPKDFRKRLHHDYRHRLQPPAIAGMESRWLPFFDSRSKDTTGRGLQSKLSVTDLSLNGSTLPQKTILPQT